MKFDIVTIFPQILDSYQKESILGRAQKKRLIEINCHNLRDYTKDKHKMTDDKPFGGGPGMIMMIEPIYKAIEDIKKKNKNSKVVLVSPQGKKFNQKKAEEFSRLDQLVLICGRYEGVDERIKDIIDDVVSIGDYVLSGGELPAMVITEAVSRLLPGVLGNEESLVSETHQTNKLDFPQYTRPREFKTKTGKTLKVPDVLLSGNHAEIEKWRRKRRKKN